MAVRLNYNEEYTFKNEVCTHCAGYFGPSFEEPLCGTCHAFLYPDNPFTEYPPIVPCDEKVDECDSGNEEPRDSVAVYRLSDIDPDAMDVAYDAGADITADWLPALPEAAAALPLRPTASGISHHRCRDNTCPQCQDASLGASAANGNITPHAWTSRRISAASSNDPMFSSSDNQYSLFPSSSNITASNCSLPGVERTVSPSAQSRTVGTGNRPSAPTPDSALREGDSRDHFNSMRELETINGASSEPNEEIRHMVSLHMPRTSADNNDDDDESDSSDNDQRYSPPVAVQRRRQRNRRDFFFRNGVPSRRRYDRRYYDGDHELQGTGDSTNRQQGCPHGSDHHQLQERLCLLTNYRRYAETAPPPSDAHPTRLPPEVWSLVLHKLDDVSLWQCTQVCSSWREMIFSNWGHDLWRRFTLNRWRFFKPIYAPTHWHAIYSALMSSSPCRLCQVQMLLPLHIAAKEDNSWRLTRLKNENKSLMSDPPEGIEAAPLDPPDLLHWQASIRGPVQSPYQGGTFYLHIIIPPRYPLGPPVVRFLTKIFHPNISCHGDIGLDSIHHNWSLALTISKVLISIQSLLTDPYTTVSMYPRAAALYDNDRAKFDKIAREWTWRYAMTDTIQPRPTADELRLCEAASHSLEDEILEPLIHDTDDEDQDNNDPQHEIIDQEQEPNDQELNDQEHEPNDQDQEPNEQEQNDL